MIDLSLFRVPAFNAALSANTFGFFVNFSTPFIAQYLQLVLGLSPFEAGLWTVPYASASSSAHCSRPCWWPRSGRRL